MRKINALATMLVTVLLLAMTVGVGAADERQNGNNTVSNAVSMDILQEEDWIVNLQEGDILISGETHGLMFNPEALPQYNPPMILVGIIPEGETIGRWQVLTYECEPGIFMLDIHEDMPPGECKIAIAIFEQSQFCGLFNYERITITDITIVIPYIMEP